MADIFDKDKRSDIMSRIRGKNTKVELLVFRYLRREGVYFQKHYRTKEGVRLDIALPRKHIGVFIDGDFWHGRTLDKLLERRGPDDFWVKKCSATSPVTKNRCNSLPLPVGKFSVFGKVTLLISPLVKQRFCV